MRPTARLAMQATRALRMQPTRIMRSNDHPNPKNGIFLGGWGDIGSQTQKNITTYALSPNRQAVMAGAMHAAVFNVARRTRNQILYWLPPLLVGYAIMQWAIERNEYLNSKPGRFTEAAQEMDSVSS